MAFKRGIPSYIKEEDIKYRRRRRRRRYINLIVKVIP